ncbi:MAG TPA: hypothetical protein VGK73_16655 [Polyangiaceae bacterium]
MARLSYAPSALLLLTVSFGCGGSTQPAKEASEGDAERSAAAESGGEDSPADSDSEDKAASAAAEKRPVCDDGTCTPCGGALCPSGWYCDESAKGGPACGWLPECVAKPTCACVKRAFSGCSCEDQGGAAHVSCG